MGKKWIQPANFKVVKDDGKVISDGLTYQQAWGQVHALGPQHYTVVAPDGSMPHVHQAYKKVDK